MLDLRVRRASRLLYGYVACLYVVAYVAYCVTSHTVSRGVQRTSLSDDWLTIRLARVAYRRVERVSSRLKSAADTVAIMAVEALPPREALRRWVSLESRYGTCCSLAPE